jgi:hypothetical protein
MNMLRKAAGIAAVTCLVAAALLVSGGPRSSREALRISVARAEESCSVGSLHGTYATHAQGTIIGQLPAPLPVPPFPFSEVGTVTFDGRGHITSGKIIVNVGGVVAPVQVSGSGSTYTVNSDCTGTVNVKTNVGFDLHEDNSRRFPVDRM